VKTSLGSLPGEQRRYLITFQEFTRPLEGNFRFPGVFQGFQE